MLNPLNLMPMSIVYLFVHIGWVKVFYSSGVAAKKGKILSVSLNGAMAVMSNQLKSRLESGVTTPHLHQVKTGQKHPQLTLHCSLNALRLLLSTPKYSRLYLTPFYKFQRFKV